MENHRPIVFLVFASRILPVSFRLENRHMHESFRKPSTIAQVVVIVCSEVSSRGASSSGIVGIKHYCFQPSHSTYVSLSLSLAFCPSPILWHSICALLVPKSQKDKCETLEVVVTCKRRVRTCFRFL